MPLTALALVLLAALLHATWNLVIAGARDIQATTALAIAIGVVIVLPFAVLRWNAQPEVWPFVAASAVLEIVYFWLLTTAYGRAELSLTYPIARGAAPVIVLVVSVAVLGVATSAMQALGVGLVGGGVILVRGLRAGARWADVLFALVIASVIASYTLVDNQGVRHADPITYLALILVPAAIVAPAFIAWRGGVQRLRRALDRKAFAGGLASMATYALVLTAFTIASAPAVAAVREVGVVFATIGGALFLHERVNPARYLGAVAVAVGVALVVAG
jgi:drug/metabolite transporter (DMT)-like permease